MTIDGLKCLKKRFENLPDYALSEDYDKEIIRLIDREIKRVESRRKVPLVPCRNCGIQPIVHIDKGDNTYKVRCCECLCATKWQFTEKEARIAWNEAQKGGEQ